MIRQKLTCACEAASARASLAIIATLAMIGAIQGCSLKEEVTVSNVVYSKDNSQTLRVIRRESPIPQEPGGDGPIQFDWLLRHECIGREHREFVFSTTNSRDAEDARKLRYDLSWDGVDWTFSITDSLGYQRTGIVLKSSMRVIGGGTAVDTIGQAAGKLSDALRDRLTKTGVDDSILKDLGVRQIEGMFAGAKSTDFVCEHANTLLIIGPEFVTHGDIVSKGPIVCIGSAKTSNIASDSWIVFLDQAFPRGRVDAVKVYVATTVYTAQATFGVTPTIAAD